MHNLLHIVNDAERFGVLHNFSGFPFENYLQKIKQMLWKKDNSLSQIVRRKTEQSLYLTKAGTKSLFSSEDT